ncbi:MAG: glycosyltransferase family 4 protein [Mariniphaga sp.]|nr:glycosyltransferase family 4 protein [Mariniphaga sp.]
MFIVKLFRKQIIYHYHNKGVSENKDWLHRKLYQFQFKNSKAILLSPLLYNEISEYITKKDTFFCANGIPEIDNIKQSFATKENKKVKIMFLSNLIESKGVMILLEACTILKKKQLNFQCSFIGAEGDIKQFQLNSKINELEISNHVSYLGSKYGSSKFNELNITDIFVHPTYNDCFPLVLIEAMQHSLPIVSTYEGAIPELVSEGVNGYLVPTKNTRALAEKLEILIKNSELRHKMGINGRNKYEKEFTINKFENRLLQILKDNVESVP